MTQDTFNPDQKDDHDEETQNAPDQAENVDSYADHPNAALFSLDPDELANSAEALFFSALQTLRDSMPPNEYNTVIEYAFQDIQKAFIDMQKVAQRHKSDSELFYLLHEYAVGERNELRIRLERLEGQYQSMEGIIEATLGHLIKTIKNR